MMTSYLTVLDHRQVANKLKGQTPGTFRQSDLHRPPWVSCPVPGGELENPHHSSASQAEGFVHEASCRLASPVHGVV